MESWNRTRPSQSLLGSVCAVAACAFAWGALLTFDAGDWPSPNQFPHNHPVHNACGPVGAWVTYHVFHMLGDGSYPLLLFLSLATALRLVRGTVGRLPERALGVLMVVLCTSVSSHLIATPGTSPLPVGHGGLAGFSLGELMMRELSGWGTTVVITASLIVGLLFATEGWVLTLPSIFRRIGSGAAASVQWLRKATQHVPIPRVVPVFGGVDRDNQDAVVRVNPKNSEGSRRNPRGNKSTRTDPTYDTTAEADPTQASKPTLDFESTTPSDSSNQASAPRAAGRSMKTESAAAAALRGGLASKQNPLFSDEATDPSPTSSPVGDISRTSGLGAASKIAKLPASLVVRFAKPENISRDECYPKQIENWHLPDLALLHEPEYGFNTAQEVLVREQAKVLEKTLEEFRVDARVVEIDTGPVITMFELRVGAGIKVSQVSMLSNDIARALKSHAVRVVAPIPGKNTVGIEVPNLQKEKVRLKELIGLSGKKASEMGLPIFLGKDAAGAALVADLTKMPHMLIAGTTGSGKSVCLNAVILSILMTKRPDHVKLILIDPKMVEMSQYKEVPHLMCPLVTDMQQAEKILEWAVTKMDERYEILAEARVRNIAAYNDLGAEDLYSRLKPANDGERARIAIHLPFIVIIIDELADLMMTAAKEVEHHLSRLAQKSRAVGIHIIVATQRPEVKVVTGLIKSNLPARICFRVASRMDSRIVLDQNGGEVLMGQGDMLFLPPGSHKLLRAQGTYLEDDEVQAVLDDLSSRAQPEFHPELVSLRAKELEGDLNLRDPLFGDAVRVVLESRRGSVSLLQRKLTIGYSRASRLIDQMAIAGIVGDYKGSQAREVTMSIDEWNAVQSHAAKDKAAGFEADQDDPFFEEG